MMSHPAVPISELADHIDRLRANSGARFSAEYESIDPGQQLTWDAASQDDNKPKNRYANVIAYDHSRVQLCSLGKGTPVSRHELYLCTAGKSSPSEVTQGSLSLSCSVGLL